MARAWNGLLMAAVVLGSSPGLSRAGAGTPPDAHGAAQASRPPAGHARRAEREAKRAARKLQRQMRRQEQQQESQQLPSPAPDAH